MTDYKNIKGKKIKFFTSDLSGAEAEGQIYYVNASPGAVDNAGSFKTVISTAAWSSGGNITTATRGITNTGSVDASVAYGGYTTTQVATTLEYNGVGWANASDMPGNFPETSKGGTQTAVISAGGSSGPPAGAATREYDGTNWTAGGNLGTGRYVLDGDGIQTAAFVCGGNINPGSGVVSQTLTEEYNGTSWSESGDLSNARNRGSTAGLQTAGLAFGGAAGVPMTISSVSSSTEEYDGSSWTSGGTMGTGRYSVRGGGIQTNALAFGGNVPAKTANTELYDGTTWTETGNLATENTSHGGDGLGTTKSWLSVGGTKNPGNTNLSTTQEFHITTSAITAAAFAAGGDNNTYSFGRNWANQGTQNATYINGGYTYINNTEEYNGTSWSEDGDTSNGRYFGTGAGTLTAGLAFGGYLTTGATNVTEEYNGSSWTSGGNMNVTTGSRNGGGTQTAGIASGGTGPITATEYYNGSSWATQPATLNETHRERNGVGTQSSYVVMGGTNPGETVFHTDVEEYNGSAWTSVAEMVVASKNAAGIIGNSAAGAVYCGGQNDNPATNVEGSQVFNGTSVSTGVAPAFVARSGNQGAGTTSSGLISGRYSPANSKTEEFTGETSALNLKTITDS